MAKKTQAICSDCLNIKTCKDIPTEFELINCTEKVTENDTITEDEEIAEEE